MPSFTFEQIPELSGRVAIVTGGNHGIGEITIRELTRKGCKVYMFSRNEERAKLAIERIEKGLGENTKKNEIKFIQFDSSDNQSIKKAVDQFKSEEGRLDILVNNAAIMATPYEMSKDGIEIQQATNAIGPAILTCLLLDILIKTARQTKGKYSVRIIQTSSSAHSVFGKGPPKQSWSSKEEVNREQSSAWLRYGQSKVANILLANELTRILSDENICNLSLNPGNVSTGLLDYDKLDPKLGFMRSVLTTILPLTFISPDKGTISTLYAATSPLFNDVKKFNGLYIESQAKHSKPAKHARDLKFANSFLNFVKMIVKETIELDIDYLIEEAKK